jgi:small subunit ribosomal protein S20
LAKGDPKAAAEQFKLVAKRLDQVAATGTIHKRTAARKKSRLAKKLNALLASQRPAQA